MGLIFFKVNWLSVLISLTFCFIFKCTWPLNLIFVLPFGPFKNKTLSLRKSHLVEEQLSQQNEIVFKVYFALFLKGFRFLVVFVVLFCGTVVSDIFICLFFICKYLFIFKLLTGFVQQKYVELFTIFIKCSFVFFLSTVSSLSLVLNDLKTPLSSKIYVCL